MIYYVCMKIIENYDFTDQTTMRLPVVARYYGEVFSISELQEVLDWCRNACVQPILMGESSNCVWAEYLDACVIKMNIQGIQYREYSADSILAVVGAGVNWDEFVLDSLNRGYSGLEALSAIPGTVGACPIQNVGAYGAEVSQRIQSVDCIEISTGQLVTFSNSECGFGYRMSNFKTVWAGQYCITSVSFFLDTEFSGMIPAYTGVAEALEGQEITPLAIREVITNIRWKKLPKPEILPNCGSFFMNPVIPKSQLDQLQIEYPTIPVFATDDSSRVKISAGWLIEQCGYKGKQVGHFAMYIQNALVLTHTGGGTAAELWEFVGEIQNSVREKFGSEISPEPNRIGF